MHIKDHKNRLYRLIEMQRHHVLMECVATGDKVKIAHKMFKQCGFKTA